MNIIIRDYKPSDAAQVVQVYRDSFDSNRKSRGGLHPDKAVDELLSKTDNELHSMIAKGVLMVAQIKETGELAGIGGISNKWINRLLKSTYSKNHCVKERFQHGRCGVSVGSLIRKSTIDKARHMGFTKIYGYSTPEAITFHKKFGARFFPQYNFRYLHKAVELQYYEIALRPGILNNIRLEPYLFQLGKIRNRILSLLRKLVHAGG